VFLRGQTGEKVKYVICRYSSLTCQWVVTVTVRKNVYCLKKRESAFWMVLRMVSECSILNVVSTKMLFF
jgi:hypothetical protein